MMKNKEQFVYDRTLKELFSHIPKNFIKLLTNQNIFAKLQQRLYNLDDKKREDYFRKFLYLLRLRPKFNKILKKPKEYKMPFIIEKESDPLYIEGIEQGIEQGRVQGVKELVLKLLDILDDETISQKTGISKKEIQNLRKQNSKDINA